jgi:hypothetical protein
MGAVPEIGVAENAAVGAAGPLSPLPPQEARKNGRTNPKSVKSIALFPLRHLAMKNTSSVNL